jgi:hypothetical protein
MEDGKSAATRFLYLATHKNDQSDRPSKQLAIYNKCDAMPMMAHDRATDGTSNSE